MNIRSAWRKPCLLPYRTLFRYQTVNIFILGFCSGLPLLLIFGTLSFWLREAGISRSHIGLFSLIGLIYGLKFLWAPLTDHLSIPILSQYLGKRRAWLCFSLSLTVGGLLGIAWQDPQNSLHLLVWFSLLTAIASATFDINVDAFRIESAAVRLQGIMAAAYQAGYRLAMFVASAGALMLAAVFSDHNLNYDYLSWKQTYIVMAVLSATGLLLILRMHEPPDSDQVKKSPPSVVASVPTKLYQMFVLPFTDFWQRYGWYTLLILGFISCYRIADIVLGVMANPFYVDMGFSKVDIATVSKSYGIIITLVGSFLGGFLLTRFHMLSILLLGVLLTALTNLLFAVLALTGNHLWGLIMVISADNLSAGIATSALIAYLSSLTNRHFTATQYALFSSVMLILPKFIAGFSGFIVDAAGYPVFFTLTSFMGIPAAILVILLMIQTKNKRVLSYF